MIPAPIARWLSARPRSFQHGAHPDPHKDMTSGLAIEHMPLVDSYVLPLSQHAGAPSKACVHVGERVRAGQCVAEADGFHSVALHAPVSGTVEAIALRPHPSGGLSNAIVLRTDFFADHRVEHLPECDLSDHAAIVAQVQRGGVVGMGGAAYPAHEKLRLSTGKRVDVVILNGAECEPYLTSDHRTMLEHPDAVVQGLTLIMRVLGAVQGKIGVEVNKADAIAALHAHIADDPRMAVVPLQVKYPEGAKQMMIEAVTGARVPLGGRSTDIHVTIHNVASSAGIFDACVRRVPVTERVITVTGPGVRRPANVLAKVGTRLADLLAHCGGLTDAASTVILGGAMMGQAQVSLDAPVVKATTGVLVLEEPPSRTHEAPCIRCGKCLDACAMFLNPTRLAALTRSGNVAGLTQQNVKACFECGSCAFVCPSHIPLTELIRTGKMLVRKERT
ncbi:MAG: electron transport complex subunit RsxC [Pseudomonadota bacterium]|jgi:electron transport complex protein RnfC